MRILLKSMRTCAIIVAVSGQPSSLDRTSGIVEPSPRRTGATFVREAPLFA